MKTHCSLSGLISRLLALLFCAGVLSPSASAQVGGVRDYIQTEDVRDQVRKMYRDWREARTGQRNMVDVLKSYAAKTAMPDISKRDQAIAFFVQGHLFVRLARTEDAVRSWRMTLTLYPQFPDAHVAIGQSSLAAQDVKTARKHAKAALAIHPRHVKAIVLRGSIAESETKLEKAIAYYMQAFGEDATSSNVLSGLARNYARLYKQSFNEERKADYAARARAVVDGWVGMKPDLPQARLFQANIYNALGDSKTAILKLESTLEEISNIQPQERMQCLGMIFELRLRHGDISGGIHAIDRILAIPGIPTDEAAFYRGKREDLKDNGILAYLKWKVDAQTSIVSNRGRSPTERRDAMRTLHSLLEDPQFANDERFSKMIESAWRACVRTLSGNTPPELSIDMLQFFRRVLRDPKTIRIVVHFLYPQGIERNVTENVRIEATRTYATLGGIAAIPTLIYTLNDDSRGVTRAIDIALCDLLDVRSKITAGAGPVTLKEQKYLREEWVRWARSPVGAAQLVKSIAALRVAVGGDEAFKRKQQRNPIADHLMQVVVMDDDMPFNAWKAGYEFTSAFLSRNFLPPELRKKPLTPELRAKAVEGVKKFWQGK